MVNKIKKVTETDKLIGARVREIRISLGYTRTDLASLVGIAQQQLEKYEKGTNRVPLVTFFRLLDSFKMSYSEMLSCIDINGVSVPKQTKDMRLSLEVGRNFAKLKTREQKVFISDLVRNFSRFF